jgi:hypothetical protein
MQLSSKTQEILTGAAERIERLRKADCTIRLVNARGRPVTNQTVQVEMTRHAFLFGANIFPLFEFADRSHETTPLWRSTGARMNPNRGAKRGATSKDASRSGANSTASRQKDTRWCGTRCIRAGRRTTLT